MKKTKLTRSLLAACSIVALTAVMYGCVHDGGDGPTLSMLDVTGYDTAAGATVEAGTYDTDGVPTALASALEGYSGTTMGDTGDTVTVGDYTFTCVAGPCSVAVAPDDSHFTVVGTINVAATPVDPVDPGPTDAEIQAEGMLIAEAIGPGSTRADATPDDVDADNPLPFSIDGGEITTTTPADMSNDFGEPNTGSWTSDDTGSEVRWTFTYTDREDFDDDGEGVMDWVLSFSDIADPTDAEYAMHYQQSNVGTGDDQLGAGITSITDDADDSLNVINFGTDVSSLSEYIDVADFPTGDRQTFVFDDDATTTGDDEDENALMGSFHGVPGTYNCAGTTAGDCTVTTNMMGEVITFAGTWNFTPDEQGEDDDAYMAAGTIPDPDYMDFGIWVQRTTAENEDEELKTTVAALAFAQGERSHEDVADVEGMATYKGPSLGIYMTKQFDPATGDAIPTGSGNYYATAELTAYFGGGDVPPNKEDTITGTVKHFGADDENGDFVLFPGTEDWVLELMLPVDGDGDPDRENSIDETPGTFTGVTIGMNGESEGDAGSWSGTFHGADDATTTDVTEMPVSVSGTYDGHFNNGHVLGAFGANMVEED